MKRLIFSNRISGFLVCTIVALLTLQVNAEDDPRQVRQAEALQRLLLEYDSCYDADANLIQIKFRSPGYHTAIKSGTQVHPTRESLTYAIALLKRDGRRDAERAQNIIRKVVSLQYRDRTTDHWGTWPYVLEEMEMPDPDLNWADFLAARLAQILTDHRDQVNLIAPEIERALKTATQRIVVRNVQPSYTNIAVLGGAVAVRSGELLDHDSWIHYGRSRLQDVIQHAHGVDGFAEYNSPPYSHVVIGECERGLQMIEDKDARIALEKIHSIAWHTIARSFHPPSQQWAGPHSRMAEERIQKPTTEFLSARLPRHVIAHPTQTQDKSRGYEVVKPIDCPKKWATGFTRAIREPYQIRRRFVRSDQPKKERVGTTWFSPTATLGTVNASSFWTQRKPIIGYWKTVLDPAVAFRVRFLNDGRDFASMNVNTVQRNNRAAFQILSMPKRGDWHYSLDRPEDGIFTACDLRLRLQLTGKGVEVTRHSDHLYELSAGTHRLVVHTPEPAHFNGLPIHWRTGKEQLEKESVAYVEGVAYEGEPLQFDFSRPIPSDWFVGIELLSSDDKVATAGPKIVPTQSGSRLIWYALQANEALGD